MLTTSSRLTWSEKNLLCWTDERHTNLRRIFEPTSTSHSYPIIMSRDPRDNESRTMYVDVTTGQHYYIYSPGHIDSMIRLRRVLAIARVEQERSSGGNINARTMDTSRSEHLQNVSGHGGNSAPVSRLFERRRNRHPSSLPQHGPTLYPTQARLVDIRRSPTHIPPSLFQSMLATLRQNQMRHSHITVPIRQRRTSAANRSARSHSSDSEPATIPQRRGRYSIVQFSKSARRGRRVFRHLLNTIDIDRQDLPVWFDYRTRAHKYLLPRPYRILSRHKFQNLTQIYCEWDGRYQSFLQRVPLRSRSERCQRVIDQMVEAMEDIPSSDESDPEYFVVDELAPR